MIEYRRSKLPPEEQRAYDELVRGIRSRETSIVCHVVNMDSVKRLFLGVYYDHPELFYMNCGAGFSGTGGLFGWTVTAMMDYIYTEEEVRVCQTHLRRVEEEIRSRITAGMSEFDVIMRVAEYLVVNCEYEIDDRMNQNAAAAICYKKAQCSGYARAVTYLLDRLGIWSIVVSGEGQGSPGNWDPHAWNIVRVGEHYYHLDVTFMEAYNKGYVRNATLSYLFYDDALCSKDHKWDRSFYPACTDPSRALKERRISREGALPKVCPPAEGEYALPPRKENSDKPPLPKVNPFTLPGKKPSNNSPRPKINPFPPPRPAVPSDTASDKPPRPKTPPLTPRRPASPSGPEVPRRLEGLIGTRNRKAGEAPVLRIPQKGRSPVSTPRPSTEAKPAEPKRYRSESELKNALREALRERRSTLEFYIDLTGTTVAPVRIIRACFDDAWEGSGIAVRLQIVQLGPDRFKLQMQYS